MQATSFGHIILGKFTIEKESPNDFRVLSLIQNKDVNEFDDNESIPKALSKFWDVEDINKGFEILSRSKCKQKEQKAVED